MAKVFGICSTNKCKREAVGMEQYMSDYNGIFIKRGIDIVVLEGSYSATMNSTGQHQQEIPYPDGFTKDNCAIISAMIKGVGSGVYTYGKITPPQTAGYLFMNGTNPWCALSSSVIRINTSGNDNGTYNISYKLVLLLTELG